MKTMRGKPVFVLVLVMIAAVSCSSFNGHRSRHRSSIPENTTDIHRLSIDAKATSTRLVIDAKVDSGSQMWTLYSPDSAIWERAISGGEYIDETLNFPAVPGEWRLEITSDEAVSSYKIEWSAQDSD